MVEELIRRRQMLIGDAAVDPYAGFVWGRIYKYSQWVRTNGISISDTSKVYYKGSYVTPFYPITANHTYVYPYNVDNKTPRDFQGSDFAEASCVAYSAMTTYSNRSAQLNTYGGRADGIKAVIKITSGVAAVFCSTVPKEDFYIYDRTEGVYLFRGKNVIANSQ